MFIFVICIIQYLVIFYQFFSPESSPSPPCTCRNHLNESVDWFILYKLPRLPYSTDPFIANGTGYIYLDSSSSLDQWHFSSKSIESSLSLTGLTLESLYKSKENSFMFYNDQPPNHPLSLIYGHSKGVLAFHDQTQTGFWLIHSVPHFPSVIEQGYEYPSSGNSLGIHFFKKKKIPTLISLNRSSIWSNNVMYIIECIYFNTYKFY